MTTLTLPPRFGIRVPLAGILHRWRERRQRRLQLRRLDHLPPYLLRDLGIDHLTREERDRLGGYHRL
ncbi:DUF1127 domain-containing protein [Aestuariicoccus sp. MJ-SS9]|uniref:DUF1127 domain-containing protein n=1 Tax=Aestuariicoccus sp. MJ-SS9 TaxID=3079855 RepID=UPI00290DAB30|nr:DUF1127 domain-containing protein [Aestuariicoccus sp. MJ-SS9]MDU8914110.1 DUF1127 domain-containing protein [Aestuariicoccus sp. MJ-SS9]